MNENIDFDPDYFKNIRHVFPEQWMYEKNSLQFLTYFGSFNIILENLPSKKTHKNILEVGCGTGRLSFELDKLGYNVTGIDYSKNAIGFSELFVPNGTFKVIDLTTDLTKDILNEKADIIIFREVLEHINTIHHNNIFNWFFKNLNEGGIVILSVPSVRAPINRKKHFKHYTIKELESLLNQHGFTINKSIGNIKYTLLYKILYENNVMYKLTNLLMPYIVFKIYGFIYNKFFNISPIKKCGRLIVISNKNEKAVKVTDPVLNQATGHRKELSK